MAESSGLDLLDGSADLDPELVGGKAWAINNLNRLGLPVPPAFTLGTRTCVETLSAGEMPAAALDALFRGMEHLEKSLDRTFGGERRPLFVSVRSGAARSMPGMMDTILNVGVTSTTIKGLAAESGKAHAANIEERFTRQFTKVVGRVPPSDPRDQLVAAATAVFRSWMSPRAIAYRRRQGQPDDAGTAVTIQGMVFGTLDERSGTGVLFTRNPLSGACEPLGEWLPQAQGEDVVSGSVTPLPLAALEAALPEAHRELVDAGELLEREARDVQDIEFTIESGRLWLLQTRVAKRSHQAAVRLAISLRREGLLTDDELLARICGADLTALLRPCVDPEASRTATVLAQGRPACPGVATGIVVGTSEDAEARADAAESAVLATATTDPEDVHGMIASVAVITELGGSTSHAAVVSRELGRPCVVGCGSGSLSGLVGRQVTVDGGAGVVYAGKLPTLPPAPTDDPDLADLVRWARVQDLDELFRVIGGIRPTDGRF